MSTAQCVTAARRYLSRGPSFTGIHDTTVKVPSDTRLLRSATWRWTGHLAVSFDLFGRAYEESSGSDIITSEKSDEILESSALLVTTPLRHLYVNFIIVSIQLIGWSLFFSLSTLTSM